MGEFVRVETDQAMATTRLARPPMNALNARLDTGLEIERLHFAGLFATKDQRTGMRGFVENGSGKATFAGR